MNKKTILFLGLMVCFLGILAYVETLEKQKQAQLEQTELKQTEISEPSLQGETGGVAKKDEEHEIRELEESNIEEEKCLIPLVSLEEWQVSGPFDNSEYCEGNKFFLNMIPAYCSLAGLKDSYSVFWKKDIQPKETSLMFGTIVVSVFEFSDASSVAIEDVVSAHNMSLKFLKDFELEGITIQRQGFRYGIRLISQEEAEKLSEQEIAEQTISIVSYFDIFALDNFVFMISYDKDYKDEAKIIEKAIIENNQ